MTKASPPALNKPCSGQIMHSRPPSNGCATCDAHCTLYHCIPEEPFSAHCVRLCMLAPCWSVHSFTYAATSMRDSKLTLPSDLTELATKCISEVPVYLRVWCGVTCLPWECPSAWLLPCTTQQAQLVSRLHYPEHCSIVHPYSHAEQTLDACQ